MIPQINIDDFSYDLPEERIAKYPLEQRDASKLLIYKDGKCKDSIFKNIETVLPKGSLMIFNDTKVVPARLFFRRDSGARIEIFCLKPYDPADYSQNFASVGSCVWRCIIGNAKRWKDDALWYDFSTASDELAQKIKALELEATLLQKEDESALVRFSWKGELDFSQILELCGKVPIPPYLNRNMEPLDIERYQTTYAHLNGSVAAPTAGLHFTEKTSDGIRRHGIETDTVCLHVGAGTFLPVKSEEISGHIMHREPFSVRLPLLRKLLDAAETGRKVIAVGTTSVRTLESLYYAGVSCIETGKPTDIDQWVPYTRNYSYSPVESLTAIINYLTENSLEELKLETRIIIVPGFHFRLVDVLVTNFHQPKSTLLLLVSAFVGGNWRSIYNHALAEGYRFLSYGDSSLLYRHEDKEFDEIRPYDDEEMVKAMSRLSSNPYTLYVSKYFFPNKPVNFISKMLRKVSTIDELQSTLMVDVVNAMIAKTSEGFTISGAENLNLLGGKKFLAISNHRDIVVDPALIQYAIHDFGLPYSRICVGNNLLRNRNIADIMKSNRMIIVIRGIGARQLYLSSLRLSKFIRKSISTGESSVWIAQREGRAKNGIDATEQGLLKMFDMSGEKDFVSNFSELNIVPFSISYEYESCDGRKAREIYISRKEGKYVKKRNEDIHSILTGIRQMKGHIHLTIGQPLNIDELQLAGSESKNERYLKLMSILDRRIISGYHLWKTNYMGFDLLNGTSQYLGVKYLPEDMEAFKAYIDHRLVKASSGLDKEEVRKIFYEIYGNPVVSANNINSL